MTSPPFTPGTGRTALFNRGHQIQESAAFVTSNARMSRCLPDSRGGAVSSRSGMAQPGTWV